VSVKTRAPLAEALPFWFPMMSPLIGLAAGVGLAWLLSQA